MTSQPVVRSSSAAPRVFGLVFGGFAALIASVSCESYEPGPEYGEFHTTFALPGTAHAQTSCEGCHALAAQQQNLPNELPQGNGHWTTKLSQACQSCHPFYANEPQPLQLCSDPVASLGERCLFEGYHGQNQPGNCEQGPCHSRYDDSWSLGDDPNANPHLAAPLTEVFPLLGGHGAAACIDCHPVAGGEAAERGQAKYCGNCHDRVGEGRTVSHYPPARLGWTDERERDCKACHATESTAGVLQVATTWELTPKYAHQFLTPHRTVQDWDAVTPVATAIADWKADCEQCHQNAGAGSPGVYDQFYCTNCHPNDATFAAQFGGHVAAVGAGTACNNTDCHPTGGPNEP